MTLAHKVLAGLLLLQAALAALFWLPSGAETYPTRDLVGFDKEAISRLSIRGLPKDDEPAEPVVLERAGGAWVVTSAAGYPAKQDRVDEIIDNLASLEVSRPVATTEASFNSLKVGDANYTREIEITAGDAKKKLLLGGASGSRVHVREVGADQAFRTKGFSVWSIGDTASRFVDTAYLEVDTDQIASLSVTNPAGQVDLYRQDGVWTAATLPEGKQVSATKVDDLLRQLKTVRLSEPVSKAVSPDHGLDGGTRVEWSLEPVTDDAVPLPTGLSIGAAVDDNKVYVKADDNDFVVKASKASLNKLTDTSMDDLLEDAPEPADGGAPE